MKYRFAWLVLALSVAAATMVADARGAEPVEAFLDALRQRHLFDEALDYLDRLSADTASSESMRQRAEYERGVTLLDTAAARSDAEMHGALLKRAGEVFAKFVSAHGDHPLAGSAKIQMATILVEEGRAAAHATDKSDASEARKLFKQAGEQLDVAAGELDARLEKMPKLVPPEATELQEQKRRAAADLAQARLLRPSVEYELAKTFDAQSAEAKKHLKAAAKSYSALYETYRTRSAGLLARLWEGRCYQEMGEVAGALGCYRELMDLPASAETRSIKSKSTRHALECWTSGGQTKYQEAIERGERWEQEAGEDANDADALAIRYLTALAYQAQSKSLPAKDPARKKLLGSARQAVTPVAMHPGEYQRPAKVMLVALGGAKDKDPKDKDAKESPGRMTTFNDAMEAANRGLEQMQEATDGLKAKQEKGDEAEVRKLTQQKTQITTKLLDTLRKALRLANDKTSLEELNSVRWYICFLLWDSGQYYEAAVLGEFLARHYPDTTPGQRGAKVALAAYVQLYNEAKAEGRDFEAAHIQAIGDYIFKRWPDGEEAEDAAVMLLNFAAAARQYDKAVAYLKKISPTSPRRGPAELRAGQSLWSAYLRAVQSPADDRPPQAELETLKKQAEEMLAAGLAREGDVDVARASAAFAMTQILIDSGQFDKAIELLQNPVYGPLTLVTANSPAAAREGFAAETYKMALRAYISMNPPQLKQAEGVMDALDKVTKGAGDAKASDSLTAIYVALGRELQRHMQELRASGHVKELDSVSQAFEVFLNRVTKSGTGASLASLTWAAETYYNMAGEVAAATPGSPRAKAYYAKATAGYKRLLDLADHDPKVREKLTNLIGIRMRLADCYARADDFDEATKTILEVVREKPMLLSAQVQAAEIYQARGVVDPQGYALAVSGSTPGKNGQHVLWGWTKISLMTMKDPKFEESFHHARLKMAEARLLFAQSMKEESKRKKVLEAAKQDLWSTYKQRPELGGPTTMAEYERLLKEIQKALGSQENGLMEFREREKAAGAAASAVGTTPAEAKAN